MRREKTREYILKKAAELFRHFGFYKTAMDDVASEARVGKGTIYYYFKSKYDLFAFVLLEEATRFLSFLQNSVKESKHPEERVLKASLYHIRGLRENPILFETLSDEKLLSIPDISKAIGMMMNNFYQFFGEILEGNKDKKINSEKLSKMLGDLLTSIALSPMSVREQFSEDKIELLIKSLLKGAESYD